MSGNLRSFFLACLAVVAGWTGTVAARVDGITGRSGKQGVTCAESSCHGAGGPYNYSSPALAGAASVNTSTTNSYTLAFNLESGMSAAGAGFNLAISSGGGTLNPAGGAGLVRKSGAELTHVGPATPTGGDFAWNFTWTAPAVAGPVTFYACANPVNRDGTNNGDGVVRCMTVSIPVSVAPAPPVAANDRYSTPTNTILNVSSPGVLLNDTDANGDPLTATKDDDPSHGSLALNPDGSFAYTPENGYAGPDAFTYHATDNGGLDSGVATVELTVGASNTAPVATNDDYRTARNSQLTVAAPGVLGNDTDADGDPLTATIVASPQHGDLNLAADGSFTYVPDSGYVGSDSFTYQADDDADQSNVAAVSLTVRSPSGGGSSGALSPLLLLVFALGFFKRDQDA